jgi:hypothetical protein
VRALALLLFLLLSSATRAHAQADDLVAIAQRSDVVVLARCIETHSHWDEDARVIVTDVTLAVERWFKGGEEKMVTVRTLGGRVGTVGMGASHATRFAPNTRIVALLRRSRFGPYFVMTSSAAGPLAVADGPRGPQIAVGVEMMDIEQLADRLGAARQ